MSDRASTVSGGIGFAGALSETRVVAFARVHNATAFQRLCASETWIGICAAIGVSILVVVGAFVAMMIGSLVYLGLTGP